VPALPPYIIEPIWQQFAALLPEREVNHPLGCHRPRIPDRVVFEKLVQVLVFGCAYHRIADESCSATTLRERRDEWIELGVIEELREAVLEAYDRFIGLDLSEVAVDCCITKAPCGGEKAGRSPVDRGQTRHQTLHGGRRRGHPHSRSDRLRQPPRLAASGTYPRTRLCVGRRATRGSERASRSRLRLQRYSRASRGARAHLRDLSEGQALTAWGNEALGSGEDELLAQRPQKACVVHREAGAGHRLLGGLL
jgi:transposase